MLKMFVGNPVSEDMHLPRLHGHGYSEVVMKAGLKPGCICDARTEGNSYVVFPVEADKSKEYPFLILLDELGFYDKKGISNKLSMLCINEKLSLFTLYRGNILIKMNNIVLILNVGEPLRKYKDKEVKWTDGTVLRQFTKERTWEYETFFDFSACMEPYKTGYKNEVAYASTVRWKHYPEEDIDISLGWVELKALEDKRNAQTRKAQKVLDAVTGKTKKAGYSYMSKPQNNDEWSIPDIDPDSVFKDANE